MAAKKKLVEIVVFVLCTLVLLMAFSRTVDYGVRHSEDDEFTKVNHILKDHIDPDIISFGSSVGEKSFDSRLVSSITGHSAYNCCIDGTNFEQYKGLIEAYNAYSSKKSRVLLFEAYFSFQKLSAISSIERYAAYMNDPFVYGSLYNIDPAVTYKCRYIPLYKNTVVEYAYYKAAINGWRSILFKRGKMDSLLGFVPKHMDWQKDEDAAMDAMQPFDILIQQEVTADYRQIIKELQGRGKQVIIVLPPVYERLYKEKTDYSRLQSCLQEISRETGCQLLDFSHSIWSPDKRFFYNTNHLNARGADLFSKALADSLALMPGR